VITKNDEQGAVALSSRHFLRINARKWVQAERLAPIFGRARSIAMPEGKMAKLEGWIGIT
jgi:hypothetical protein